ncbi:MAG: class A beta-lactamase-related serine hydrolase, partial [Bacilli bacterium]|nr:class A beta-lactamase-related serine hydrolase [Bacilli bacterium]
LVTSEDIFQGSGIIKNQKCDTKYTIEKLIELCLVESDNTAYIKLVRFIGKEKIIEYGKELGTKHVLDGKDSYGIVNCSDMIIIWKKIIKYAESNENGKKMKQFLSNPSVKFIKNDKYVRKYGLYDIAYHEAGYVECSKPYYMLVLTQLNKYDYKEEFINKVAKILDDINKIN